MLHPSEAEKVKIYNDRVLIHLKSKTDLPLFVIEPGTPEWSQWERYFREYLGFDLPSMARVRMKQQKAVTVPTQWPEWFDPSYDTTKGGHYTAPERPEHIAMHSPPNANYAAMTAGKKRVYGPFDNGREHLYEG